MPHLTTFLLQIIVILIAARLIGGVFRLIRQPQVIGEMAAGILLGPSLLGWLAPGLGAARWRWPAPAACRGATRRQ